ncbi:MAG: ATPase [Deltaproteobacteria bacterium RBG_13_49_15]|nr:MAG: ATPase [Deltaproteobacteria bacterium RBG_13_49_15]
MVQIMNKVPEKDGKKEKQRQHEANVRVSLGKIKNKIIVMSGKGGVGKSSVAVNLSIALSKKGFQVGLMDVDLHGPDVLRMLGLKGTVEVTGDRKISPLAYSKNLKVLSIESFTPNKDEAIIWRGPLKYSAIQQFIGEVYWGDLDFLLIDSPPGTGDEPLTIAQMIPDAKAVIVTTPQEISLADVRKSIHFCRTVKMEILGIVENMSGFKCPHCGESIGLFGSGGGEKTACDMRLTMLGKIPFDPKLVACGDAGISYQDKYEDSDVTRAFSEIAEKLSRLL